MKKIIFLCLLIFSCDTNVIDPNGPDNNDRLNAFNVKLRIQNSSAFDLKNIESNNNYFGNLNQSDFTDYEGFSIIHTYPEISAIIDGMSLNYPGSIPNDPMYEIGWYTIRVTVIDTAARSINATIIRDN